MGGPSMLYPSIDTRVAQAEYRFSLLADSSLSSSDLLLFWRGPRRGPKRSPSSMRSRGCRRVSRRRKAPGKGFRTSADDCARDRCSGGLSCRARPPPACAQGGRPRLIKFPEIAELFVSFEWGLSALSARLASRVHSPLLRGHPFPAGNRFYLAVPRVYAPCAAL